MVIIICGFTKNNYLQANINSFFQDTSIEGIVLNESGKPLFGATIKNKTTNTTTDSLGKFKLNSKIGSKLIIKLKRYKNYYLIVCSKKYYEIKLIPKTNDAQILIFE